MSITVIIVNWNGGVLLQQCLQEVLQQSYPAQKILLMDNGSTDGSAQKAAQLTGITVRFLGSNLGFAVANNRGLAECESTWVALLNPDAIPDKDWLLNLKRATLQHPTIAAFGCQQIQLNNPDKLDGIGDVYHFSGLMWRAGYGQRITVVNDFSNTSGNEIFSPCACAALYRCNALKEMGGFDEDFFCYVEDVDLGFRLRLNNYNTWYVPDAKVHHAGSASTGGHHSDFAIYYGHRNLVWAFIKNMPGALFWLLLPIHLLLNVFSLLYFTAKGKSRPIFLAKYDALKGIPPMWKKRQKIQRQRTVSSIQIWQALNKCLWKNCTTQRWFK